MVKERKYYMDFLRIISIVLVMLTHCCDNFWLGIDVSDSRWTVVSLFLCMCHCAVPMFFMISGALFLDNEKTITIKSIYTKYIPRVFAAYVVWSAIYIAGSEPRSVSGVATLFAKSFYHLWFIPVLIGCYVVVPFLRKITESEKLTKYFLAVGVIFFILTISVLPLLEDVPSKLVSIPAVSLKDFLSKMSVLMVYKYPFYMVLGYYLSKKDFSKIKAGLTMGLGVVGYALSLTFVLVRAAKTNKFDDTMFDKFSIPVLLMAVGLFVFGKYVLSKIKLSEKSGRFVSFFSKSTFGAYLIHVLFINFFEKNLGFTILSIHPVLGIPCFLLAVFVVSTLSSMVLNKIPFVKKYLV